MKSKLQSKPAFIRKENLMKPKISNARKTIIPETRIFWQNLRYLQAVHGVTDITLSKALARGCSTSSKYRQSPEETSLRDVYNAALYFGVDPAALLKPMVVTSEIEPIRLDNYDEEGD